MHFDLHAGVAYAEAGAFGVDDPLVRGAGEQVDAAVLDFGKGVEPFGDALDVSLPGCGVESEGFLGS